MVQDGVTGFVVPSKNEQKLSETIQKVATMSGTNVLTMGNAAAERAKELFDAEKYIQVLELRYKNILEE